MQRVTNYLIAMSVKFGSLPDPTKYLTLAINPLIFHTFGQKIIR